MSWLLENWFGSKESLEQVREDIYEHLHKESYLGVSGLDNPEQSSNRLPSKELFLALHGPWDNKLEEVEVELLQFIHDELPAVVRDEVGVIPFFTNVTDEGILVLAFIRNATNRAALLNKLPLNLVDPDGHVVAQKNFNMISFGAVGDYSSRPSEFLFRWNEFTAIPEKEVPLTMVLDSSTQVKTVIPSDFKAAEGLDDEEEKKYEQMFGKKPEVTPGEVDLQVLDVTSGDEGGLKVVVLFRNGLDKNLEFTEVPIIVRDKSGDEVARVRYGLQNMKIKANSSRMWSFHVPAGSLKKTEVNPAECTAIIPAAKPGNKPNADNGTKGMIQ